VPVPEVGQLTPGAWRDAGELSPILGEDHERPLREDPTGGRPGEANVTIAMTLVLLSFFGVALWAVPRLISRSAVKMPTRVPEEWVADYNSENQ
jgi:hypothetical protein